MPSFRAPAPLRLLESTVKQVTVKDAALRLTQFVIP